MSGHWATEVPLWLCRSPVLWCPNTVYCQTVLTKGSGKAQQDKKNRGQEWNLLRAVFFYDDSNASDCSESPKHAVLCPSVFLPVRGEILGLQRWCLVFGIWKNPNRILTWIRRCAELSHCMVFVKQISPRSSESLQHWSNAASQQWAILSGFWPKPQRSSHHWADLCPSSLFYWIMGMSTLPEHLAGALLIASSLFGLQTHELLCICPPGLTVDSQRARARSS